MENTVESYMAKGCSRAMAEYYVAGIKRPVAVQAEDDFTLLITFDNGEIRRYDMKPFLLPDTVFEPFMEIENFRRVYIDDCRTVCWDIDPDVDSNVVWSNKVDICPDCCYVDSVPVSGGAADA